MFLCSIWPLEGNRAEVWKPLEIFRIIMKKMQDDVFDLDAYLECGVVLRTFPLHDPNERDLVSKLWLPKVYYWPFSCCCTKTALPPFSFCKDLRKEGSDLSFAHLTALKMYFFLILSLIGRVSFVDIVSVEEKLSGRVHWENMRLAGCRCNVT